MRYAHESELVLIEIASFFSICKCPDFSNSLRSLLLPLLFHFVSSELRFIPIMTIIQWFRIKKTPNFYRTVNKHESYKSLGQYKRVIFLAIL